MNTKVRDLDIAHADFHLIYEEDPNRAIEWMNLLFADPTLIEERKAWIAGGRPKEAVDESIDNGAVINLIKKHGLLIAVREGKLSFADVEQMTWSANGLRLAHEAMSAIPEFASVSTHTKQQSLNQILDWINSVDPDDDQIVRMPDSSVSVKRDSANVAMGASAAKDSSTKNDEPKVDAASEFYGIDSKQRVFIKGSLEEIPNGLCWIGILDGERLIDKLIPTLEWYEGLWVWRRELRHFSDDQSLLDKRVKLFLIPACESTRDQFDTDEVRSVVDSLNDGEQKSRALKFLGQRGEKC